MSKHVNGADPCPSCEEKLAQAHPDLADWFRTSVKTAHPYTHISWSYRDKDSQNQAVAEGKSRLPFPMSAHNKSDDQGNPCALALDLFQLADNGMACWSWMYFRTIADEATISGAPIKWGGAWKTLGDADHFEWVKPAAQPPAA